MQYLKSYRLSNFNGMQLAFCDEHLSVLSLGVMHVLRGWFAGESD